MEHEVYLMIYIYIYKTVNNSQKDSPLMEYKKPFPDLGIMLNETLKYTVWAKCKDF